MSGCCQLLRKYGTVNEAVTVFANARTSREEGLARFTQGILNAQRELSPNDFSKLTQLDGLLVQDSSPELLELAKKLYDLCLSVLLKNYQASNVMEASRKLGEVKEPSGFIEQVSHVVSDLFGPKETKDPLPEKQYLVLQYLTLLDPICRMIPGHIANCINIASLPITPETQAMIKQLLPITGGYLISDMMNIACKLPSTEAQVEFVERTVDYIALHKQEAMHDLNAILGCIELAKIPVDSLPDAKLKEQLRKSNGMFVSLLGSELRWISHPLQKESLIAKSIDYMQMLNPEALQQTRVVAACVGLAKISLDAKTEAEIKASIQGSDGSALVRIVNELELRLVMQELKMMDNS